VYFCSFSEALFDDPAAPDLLMRARPCIPAKNAASMYFRGDLQPNKKGAVAKQHPNPKEKTEPVHCESGDTGSVFW